MAVITLTLIVEGSLTLIITTTSITALSIMTPRIAVEMRHSA
jgi:hypothetical protein